MSKNSTYPSGDKDYRRNDNLKRKYGITLDDWNNMFDEQKGCCAICTKHQSQMKQRLHVDHCHESGKVRGLLCTQCNTALGLFYDNTDIIYSAIKYLGSHEGRLQDISAGALGTT